MIGSNYLLTIEALKQQAKRLRSQHHEQGQPIGHSRSLEFLARRFG